MTKNNSEDFTTVKAAESSIDLSSPAIQSILPNKPDNQQGRISAAQTGSEEKQETKAKTKTPKKKTAPKKKNITLSAVIPEELAKEFDKVIEYLNEEGLGKVNRNILFNKFVSDFVKANKK